MIETARCTIRCIEKSTCIFRIKWENLIIYELIVIFKNSHLNQDGVGTEEGMKQKNKNKT